MEKLTRNSNFSIFHALQSNLKVLEMGCEVKKILGGPFKLCIQVFKLKTGNFYHGALRIEFATLFLEPCLPCGPLAGDLNYFHCNGKVPYGNPFDMGLGSEGGGLWQGVGAKVKHLSQLILV